MAPPASEPRGPVLRTSLRANAQPFTPSRGSHVSQPAIRRHVQNPTFVNKTPHKRKSVNGPMRQASQVRNENNPNPAPHTPAQQQATSFSNDAFIKRNAAKAYAAKKRAALKTVEQRKLDAQKGFARRQSLKAAKRAAAVASSSITSENNQVEASSSIESATAHVAASVADAAVSVAGANFSNLVSHDVAPPPSPEREVDAGMEEQSDKVLTSATFSRRTSTSSTPSLSDTGLPTLSPSNGGILSPSVSASTITDATTEDVVPSVPSGSRSSLEADLRSAAQEEELQIADLSIATVNSTMNLQPTVQSAPALDGSKRHSMTVLPSCSVDIAAFSGTVGSSCTMSTVSGGSYGTGSRSRETPVMPSSGKWCNQCAGVGLHISAMMSTMSAWRAEEERRSSQTSSSGNTSSNKGGIMRRMSQSLIGSSSAPSRSTDANRDKDRLKQQVDVLSMTVKFLHEKLQHLGAATPDVIDAVRRCT